MRDRQDTCYFRGGRHHRAWNDAARYRRLEPRCGIGGSQKAFMVPPGVAFLSIGPKAWKLAESATLPHYYFDLKKEKKNGDKGESSWTPSTAIILALGEALKYVKQVGMAN